MLWSCVPHCFDHAFKYTLTMISSQPAAACSILILRPPEPITCPILSGSMLNLLIRGAYWDSCLAGGGSHDCISRKMCCLPALAWSRACRITSRVIPSTCIPTKLAYFLVQKTRSSSSSCSCFYPSSSSSFSSSSCFTLTQVTLRDISSTCIAAKPALLLLLSLLHKAASSSSLFKLTQVRRSCDVCSIKGVQMVS